MMTYADPIDCPGNGPYAAAGLIIHESGLVLSVSRKYDMKDKGLPGGKLELGQNFVEACITEVLQETGLTVVRLTPIYANYCGNAPKHTVYWNQVFLCKVTGEIHTEEKGQVSWIPPSRLIYHPEGRLNSIGSFNKLLFERCVDLGPMFTSDWMTTIDLDPAHVESYAEPNDYFVDGGTGTFCKSC
jgi:8-oxo-dGTP pyrophosphatase MutT (NUDIX family)